MLIRIRETAAVITDHEFRSLHPNTSFPPQLTEDTLDHFGADLVMNGPQPTGEPWQSVQGDGVEEIAGQWFTKFKLVPETLNLDGLEAQRATKLSALAAKRWQVETGGIIVGGITIKTDEDTQRKVTGAYVQAEKNPAFTAKWKVATGVFVDLDAATIILIGDALTAHVQACFANEAVLTDAIMGAADWPTLKAVNIDAGWPS